MIRPEPPLDEREVLIHHIAKPDSHARHRLACEPVLHDRACTNAWRSSMSIPLLLRTTGRRPPAPSRDHGARSKGSRSQAGGGSWGSVVTPARAHWKYLMSEEKRSFTDASCLAADLTWSLARPAPSHYRLDPERVTCFSVCGFHRVEETRLPAVSEIPSALHRRGSTGHGYLAMNERPRPQ
jgi:hypothetical protein